MGDVYDNLETGQRVELISCPDPYANITPGTRGSVLCPTIPSDGPTIQDEAGNIIPSYRVVSVRWDNGSWLMLVPEAGDALRLLTDEEAAAETDVPPVHGPVADSKMSSVVVPVRAVRRIKTTAETEADKASAMLGAFHKDGDD